MILHGYTVSPYAAKVRAMLRFKRLRFEEKTVHPLRRGELKRISSQLAVPVLEDQGQVIADSTRIAAFLDERYPERPVIPRDPVLRARALLLEEWADEALPRAVQPVRWFLPDNVERTLALFRAGYPPGRTHDLLFAPVRRFLRLDMRRKYGDRFGAPPAAKILNRLADVMGLLDDALAETGWLAGPDPTVADFAAWGFLHFLDGMDGWETVRVHKRVLKMIKTIGGIADRPEAYDADDQALLDASHHRRATAAPDKKRLPLL